MLCGTAKIGRLVANLNQTTQHCIGHGVGRIEASQFVPRVFEKKPDRARADSQKQSDIFVGFSFRTPFEAFNLAFGQGWILHGVVPLVLEFGLPTHLRNTNLLPLDMEYPRLQPHAARAVHMLA